MNCEHEDITDVDPIEIKIKSENGFTYLYWKHTCDDCGEIVWEEYKYIGTATTEEIGQ